MKGKLFTIMMLGLFVFSAGIVSAAESETMNLKTNVYSKIVSISLPDEIVMPDIAPGYSSGDIGFDVKNIGTTEISITASIEDGDDIFNVENLFLKMNLNHTLDPIEEFYFKIPKPTQVGGSRTERIFVILDLTNFTGEFDGPLLNKTHPITFTAMPTNN